jgi:hypothetical protein
MNGLTKTTVLAVGLLIIPAAAFCQQAANTDAPMAAQAPVIAPENQPTDEQLSRLFEVMRTKEQMASVMKTLPAMMQQQVTSQIKTMTSKATQGTTITPEQQEALDKFTRKYMDKAVGLYPAEEMIADMSTIYKRHLSREDVDALIAFYTSPAGQHLLELTPAVMKEYLPMVMGRMQERSKALTEDMTRDLKEILPGAGTGPGSDLK